MAKTDLIRSTSNEVYGSEPINTSFPVYSLAEPVRMAKIVYRHNRDVSFSLDKLGNWLGLSDKSSGFRDRCSAARRYGVLRKLETGIFELTDLGVRLASGENAKETLVEAMFKVPLFGALIETCVQSANPVNLVTEMRRLRVPKSRRDSAVQIFYECLEFADFLDVIPENSILREEPVFKSEDSTIDRVAPSLAKSRTAVNHPLIASLINLIPPTDEEWDVAAQVTWMTALASCFKLLFENEGQIRITASESETGSDLASQNPVIASP